MRTVQEYLDSGTMSKELVKELLPHLTPELEEEIKETLRWVLEPELIPEEFESLTKQEGFQALGELFMRMLSDADYNKFEQIVKVLRS